MVSFSFSMFQLFTIGAVINLVWGVPRSPKRSPKRIPISPDIEPCTKLDGLMEMLSHRCVHKHTYLSHNYHSIYSFIFVRYSQYIVALIYGDEYLVGILFLSSFHCYYIHGSRMYITNIKRNSRTLFVVAKFRELMFKVVFLKPTKNTKQVSGNKSRKVLCTFSLFLCFIWCVCKCIIYTHPKTTVFKYQTTWSCQSLKAFCFCWIVNINNSWPPTTNKVLST